MPADGAGLGICHEVQTKRDNNEVLKKYLLEHSSTFSKLCSLRNQGWLNEEGDRYFSERRDKADNPTDKMRKSFFNMTVKIGKEMARETHVFDLQTRKPLVLDLCMAPGGFTESTISRFPLASVHAVTLSPDSGGHHVIARSTNLSVLFADVTMFAAEFGAEIIPGDHPDATSFSMDRPFSDGQYDLVFCGGAVLRTQERASYRVKVEESRLGTLRLINTICTLADVELFKPKSGHAIKSSFYLVARNVQAESKEAVNAVAEWKQHWYRLTFEGPQDDNIDAVVHERDVRGDVASILKDFGPRLIELGRPIWQIQAEALKNAKFLKNR